MTGTLEDLIDEDITEELLTSCIFQISFALTYLQKHYKFTHNDLHINNVMYTETEKNIFTTNIIIFIIEFQHMVKYLKSLTLEELYLNIIIKFYE